MNGDFILVLTDLVGTVLPRLAVVGAGIAAGVYLVDLLAPATPRLSRIAALFRSASQEPH